MVRDTSRQKQKQNKGSGSALWAGGFLLAVGVASAAAFFAGTENGIVGFAAKVQAYLLGRCVLLLPVGCFLLSWKLFWDGRIPVLHKKTLGIFLVTLCLLGTAHHVFIPVNEELTPHLLPEGGGLLGGLLSLALRRSLGANGSWLALGAVWLLGLGLLLPLGGIWRWLKQAVSGLSGKEDAAVPPAKEAEKSKNTVFKRPAIKPAGGADHASQIQKVYRSGEFGAFTDGIEKKSAFKQILSFNGGVYEQEPVKQEVEQDPIQVPEWQAEKKPAVVLRPIINYDDVPSPMPSHRFLDGSEPEAEPPRPEEVRREPRSIIHNEYREQSAPRPQSARQEEALEVREEPRRIEIFDSAEKLQPAPQTPAAEAFVSEELPEAEPQQGSAYILPPLGLLDTPKISDPASYEKDIMEQCSVLEQTLTDFRVRAKVIAVTRGPSVTRFELEPAPGVKVSSVVNLADDIALRLAAPGVRIEAPIPGKSAIGIEAPNTKNDTVCFREVVDDAKVRNVPSRLCIGLGKDISGNIISADLAKMPHLLVAGSTGSGKSVCINTIITGILYKARPEEVKLILVDPKVVELSNYNGIPHLLTPVVTEPKKAASALHWAVAEMERRYKLFADNHVREINSYNAQAQEKMPFIVIIIDELSDLMMVAKVDVEDAILRLAQKARAAGIHLILATQRPSVDVITGIVKANIPSRIAFAVSSQTDSRTIIDMGGAEKLLGKGDMLFYPIGFNKPVRVQGAFVTDAEINKIVDFIVKQSIPVNYSEEVTQQELECDGRNGNAEESVPSSPMEDELFEDALSLVLDMGQASSSMLQRRFRIGYTRAARLVDTMEELGIVGQSVGSKPREVIMSRQEAEERFLKRE